MPRPCPALADHRLCEHPACANTCAALAYWQSDAARADASKWLAQCEAHATEIAIAELNSDHDRVGSYRRFNTGE